MDKNQFWDNLNSFKLDYDTWDQVTLNNLLSAYGHQFSEYLDRSEQLNATDSRHKSEFYMRCIDEAQDHMSSLRDVIEYYSVPGQADREIAMVESKIRDDRAAGLARGKLKMMGRS